MQRIVFSIVAVSMLGLATSASAAPITVNWTGAVTDTGNNENFNTGTLTFAPIPLVDSLTSITGGGIYHDHFNQIPGPMTFTLDLRLGGVWTNVFTDVLPNGATGFVSSIGPILFAPSTLDGIRMTGTPSQNQSIHLTTSTALNFNAVPEPSSIVLVGLGTIGLVLMGRRKRRRKLAA